MSGALPNGWRWATFSDVAHIAANLVDPKDFPYLPHIAPDNIERNTGRLLAYRTVQQDGVTSAKHRFYPGQLLYSKIRPYLNKCVRVEFEGLCSADMYPLDPLVEPGYLHHYILTREFVSAVTKAAGSRTVLPKTNQKQLANVPVPVAPSEQQPAIVAAIDSHFSRLDAATATLERVQRNLERYRASVLKAAVEGRLVPTEAELAKKERRSYEPAFVLLRQILAERRRRWEEAELAKLKAKGKTPTDDRWKARYEEPAALDTNGLPELPEGWCWATVGQLISRPLVNGRSVPTAEDGFPVLRLTAIRNGRVILTERKIGNWTREDAAEWLVAEGDFLVVRGNGSRDLVGRGGRVTITPDAVAFPDTLIRVRIEAAHFEPRLLSLLWDSQVVRDFLGRAAKTTAGIYKINQRDLEKVPLPLPPRAEQVRLVDEIERLDSLATAENSRVGATRVHMARLRQALLKSAFEGRLVDSKGRE
jgi:type I restriction enzyme S subunit